jgi:hypothetical protein
MEKKPVNRHLLTLLNNPSRCQAGLLDEVASPAFASRAREVVSQGFFPAALAAAHDTHNVLKPGAASNAEIAPAQFQRPTATNILTVSRGHGEQPGEGPRQSAAAYTGCGP